MSFLFNGKTPKIPEGFLYSSAADIEAKIANFKQVGIDQLQVVLDFDRTLTVGQINNRDDSSSWQILKGHLPSHVQASLQKTFAYYRKLEVTGTMTTQHASDWWTHSLNLMTEHNLDMAAVEKDFLSKSTIRPGVKELFDLCAQYGIPTVILSAGVKDVIDIWAKTYDVQPTIILATELQLDDKKRMIGWDRDSLVHVLNKKEIGHPELTKIRTERSHTILVGDNINDSDMAEGTNNVFRVRVIDPRVGEVTAKSLMHEATFKSFDTIIENGNLYPITRLIEQLII